MTRTTLFTTSTLLVILYTRTIFAELADSGVTAPSGTCFLRKNQRAYNRCTTFYERDSGIPTSDACLAMCDNDPRCLSVTYMAPYQVCDMFWVKVGLGAQNVAPSGTRVRRQSQSCNRPLTVDSQFTYWERADKSACAGGNTGPTVADCPSGQRAYPFVISGSTLSDTSSGSAYTAATTADACAKACAQNQGLNGKPCQMSLFDGAACTLFTAPPDLPTSQAYTKKSGSTITLKYCIDQSKLPATCTGPGVVQPNTVLLGISTTAVTVNSMGGCITACASQTAFKCTAGSGAYFHNLKNNCVLNTDTVATKPSQVNVDPRDMMYFEMKC